MPHGAPPAFPSMSAIRPPLQMTPSTLPGSGPKPKGSGGASGVDGDDATDGGEDDEDDEDDDSSGIDTLDDLMG